MVEILNLEEIKKNINSIGLFTFFILNFKIFNKTLI